MLNDVGATNGGAGIESSEKGETLATARVLAVLLCVFVSVTACDGSGGEGSGTTQPDAFFESEIDLDPSEPERGPNGEEASPVGEVEELTEEEIAEIRDGGFKAALLWAGSGEWYEAMTAGAQDVFAELGIEVVATADAQFDPSKQANDVESAMARDPDVILTLIVDPVSGAQAFQPAVKSDVVLVLADNGAEGYQAGEEYVSIVTGDHYGMGQAAAELMSDAIGGEGEIGMIYHDADFFVTNNRDNSFRATVEQHMPDITIVDAKGFAEESATFDVASAMISQNPELDGIYVAWDVAAEGVVEALRSAGAEDVRVITHDLGANNAVVMAAGEFVYGTVADLPFQIGSAMATLAGYGILGKEAPPFVAGEFIKVTRDELEEAWPRSLNKPLPDEVAQELED